MKIGLIGPLPPLRGGISQYNHSLLHALRARGHDVLPISYRVLYPDFLFPGTSQFDENADPVEGAHAILDAWDMRRWLQTIALLRQEKVERLIVQHWHPFFVPALVYIVRRAMARKLTVVAHNVLPHEKQAVGKFLNPRLFQLADRIVVGAGEQAEMLYAFDIGTDIKVVPHPVYDRFFINDHQSSLQRHTSERAAAGIPPEEFYLVHLGLVREYKGVDILLQALSSLNMRPWRLEIAGEFYDDYERYDKLINDLGLLDRVIVRNQYLSDEEMARMIAGADGVALPYRHATQSGVAMAALAGGAPLIATRTGALADIVVEDSNGVLAEPGSVESLRDSLLRFMDTSLDTWRSRRNAIAEQARSAYTWDTLADVVAGGGGD